MVTERDQEIISLRLRGYYLPEIGKIYDLTTEGVRLRMLKYPEEEKQGRMLARMRLALEKFSRWSPNKVEALKKSRAEKERKEAFMKKVLELDDQNLSQPEISKILGTCQSVISKYLIRAGRRKYPIGRRTWPSEEKT